MNLILLQKVPLSVGHNAYGIVSPVHFLNMKQTKKIVDLKKYFPSVLKGEDSCHSLLRT